MRSISSLVLFSALALGVLASGCRGRAGSFATCTPSESVVIGCTSSIGTRCTGDPTLTICDGSLVSDPENCSSSTPSIGYNDDSDGLCPQVTVICPSSGSIAINPNPFGSRSYTCNYAVIRGGIGP